MPRFERATREGLWPATMRLRPGVPATEPGREGRSLVAPSLSEGAGVASNTNSTSSSSSEIRFSWSSELLARCTYCGLTPGSSFWAIPVSDVWVRDTGVIPLLLAGSSADVATTVGLVT